MKLVAAVLALAAAAALVTAECPNACSGHGTCSKYDNCECYDNWMGGDCSERVCPFGLAFVDNPLGDLNHDGTVSNKDVPTQASNWRDGRTFNELWQGSTRGEAHYYAECSGKGSCERDTGTCSCYDGYTGSACQRTTCPDDCSGHGMCYTVKEIAKGGPTAKYDPNMPGRNYRVEKFDFGTNFTTGVTNAFTYNLWDSDKNQACVCDAGHFGPDCSLQECPRGNDPLTNNNKFCGNKPCTDEVQIVAFENANMLSGTFYFVLEWLDNLNYGNSFSGSRLVSKQITFSGATTGSELADLVKSALASFPAESHLNDVTVTCTQRTTSAALTGCSSSFSTPNATILVKLNFGTHPRSGRANPVVVYQTDSAGKRFGASPPSMTGIYVQTYYKRGDDCLTLDGWRNWKYSASNLQDATFTINGDVCMDEGVVEGTDEGLPCSNRGLCDFSTGECQCFAGYTKEDCSQQSALAM